MANYDLAFPGAAIDAILTTAYDLQNAGYIFKGSATNWSGTPTQRTWLLAPAGFSGYGFSSAIPKGSIGICKWNGSAWSGDLINVVTIDSTVINGSTNAVSGDAVWDALDELATGIRDTLLSFTITDGTASADQASKLTYDVKMTDGQGGQHLIGSFNILAATAYKAGLMSAADKAKVDSFLTILRSMTFADTTAGADVGTKIVETLKMTVGGVQEAVTALTILAATTSKAGLMSAADKTYLDGIPSSLSTINTSISKLLAMLGYYECSTAAGTAAKTVSASGYVLTTGGCIRIKMTNANTADNVTLNINSTGAKALYYDGAQASSSNSWDAGDVLEVYYDGTQYQCASGGRSHAENILYDNSESGLSASNVQDAIDELSQDTSNIENDLSKMSSITLDNSQYPIVKANIYSGKWTDVGSNNRNGIFIPLSTGHDYTITVGSAGFLMYAVLTNNNAPVKNTVPPFAPGYTDRVQLTGEGTKQTISGTDGYYLWIREDYTPLTFIVTADDYFNVLHDDQVVNDLTTGGTKAPLSAEMGKEIGDTLNILFTQPIITTGLLCESNNTSALSIECTSDNNYTISCITRTSGVSGKLYIPTMEVGKKYRLTFSYTNTDTRDLDLTIKQSNGATVIRPTALYYTTDAVNYTWEFTYASNYVYFNFDCYNMSDGSVITITDLNIDVIGDYQYLMKCSTESEEFLDQAYPDSINTSGLACSSTDSSKILVECTSGNNYLVTCITRTASIYGFIRLPLLKNNVQYLMTFEGENLGMPSCNISLSNNNGGSRKGFYSIPPDTKGLCSSYFTYDNRYPYLLFFCNDLDSGAKIYIRNLQIRQVGSLDIVQDYVDQQYIESGSIYAANEKISLCKRTFSCKISHPTWSLAAGQAMAIYNNYIVRIPQSGKLTLQHLENGTVTDVFTSENLLIGHNNSAQFAPFLESGQVFPYLYVSAFESPNTICKVYELTLSSVTLVQTITFNLPSNILNGIANTQIGDDGCLYVYNHGFVIMKMIAPPVSAGDIVLDMSYVLDYFRISNPYSRYVWQGGKIYNGMLFFLMSTGATNGLSSLFIYDLANHTLKTRINVGNAFNGEVEDCDLMDGKLYAVNLNGSTVTIFDFDT